MPDPAPIDRAFFREAEDGSVVFFPWGLPHRGYVLRDERDRRRASRAASALVGATIAIGSWTAHRLESLLESAAGETTRILERLGLPGALLLLAIALYWQWAARFVEPLPESGLQLSREDRLREAAELVRPRRLTLIGVAIVALGVCSLWIDPRMGWLAGLAIALGAGLLAWSRVLARALARSRSGDRIGAAR